MPGAAACGARPRRGLLMAVMGAGVAPFALPGCGATPQRDVSLRQLDPTTTAALGGDDGIVAGVTIQAVDAPQGQPLGAHLLLRRLLVLADAAGREYGAPQGFPDAVVLAEGNVRLALHPFAFRMTAGPGEVVGLDSLTSLSGRAPRWYRQPLPSTRFAVRAGRASYIGAFGQAFSERAFPDLRARDSACPPAERFDTAAGPRCIGIRPLSEWRPDRDLPLIRARWPRLDIA